MTCTLLKEEYQDTCLTKLILVLILSSLLKRGKASGLFFFYICVTLGRAFDVKKNVIMHGRHRGLKGVDLHLMYGNQFVACL